MNDENEEKKESRKKVFENLRHDYKRSKSAKSKINDLITEWNDLYYGKSANSKSNKSKIVMKEIAKQIEWQKPNIMEPFTAPSNPVRFKGMINSNIGRIMEKYANYQFTQEFDRETFMDSLSDVLLREGTVWVKTGWELKENVNKERIKNITMEELLAMEKDPDEIKENEDGTFDVIFNNVETIINRPTAEVLRNEHVFPDPSARTDKQCRFIIIKVHKTLSELVESGFYPKEVIDKLQSDEHFNKEDTSLGSVRDSDSEDYGNDTNFQTKDKSRKRIAIMQYWGYYDLDGDNIAEPILAEWTERGNTDLRIEDNPMPSQEIPIFRDVYSARPFSLWGNALAYFIGDNQKVKTGIVRGIMDNMSLANNGQKFVQRGALDYLNFKRMRNGERHIIVNKSDSIEDGGYNELPSSIFNTMQMFNKETEDLSGVSSGGASLPIDGASQDKDGQMTVSQKKMSAIVRGVSGLLDKVVFEWISMAKMFLDNSQIEEMFSGSELEAYEAFTSKKKIMLKMQVGTEVNRNIRINQLNLLLQQSQAIGEMAPKESYSTLVSEMYELFDMYEEAQKLRDYKPEPDPMAVQEHQINMATKELELEELKVKIANLQKEGELNVAKAQNEIADAQATTEYKRAQTAEKYAKTDLHKVEGALKPSEQMRKIFESSKNKGKGVSI